MGNNTRSELHRLLQQRNYQPDRVTEIDQEIYQTFGQTASILVLDMAGFSRLTLHHGIIHFLAMVQRMTEIASPIVYQHGGWVFKQEADNLFALFPDVPEAVAAAVDIFKSFAEANRELPDDEDLYAGIGIGYGELLVLGDNDVYGCEMNLACKLGEDLARRGEILLTETAFQRVAPNPNAWERLVLSVSSLELIAYRIKSAPAL